MISSPVQTKRAFDKHSFKRTIQITENSAISVHRKQTVLCDTATYLGWGILNASKLILMEFYHSFLYPTLEKEGVLTNHLYTDSKYLVFWVFFFWVQKMAENGRKW